MGAKFIINIASFTAAVLSAVSCTAPIDINTRGSEPVLVVYGELSDRDGFHEVKLSSSADYFSHEPARQLQDAEAWLESDGRRWSMSQSPVPGEEGTYITNEDIAAVAGRTYTLHVDIDFDGDGSKESYTAATKALRPVALDSIKLVPQTTMGIKNYNLLIYGQEPPEENFYIFQLMINGKQMTNKLTDYLYMNDMAVNGTYLDGFLFGMYLSIEHEDMIPPDRREDAVLLGPGDEVTLRVLNVEEGFYNFISQCKSERRGSNPFFGGPYSNIESNILPSGAGYFAAYSTSEVSATVPEEEIDS